MSSKSSVPKSSLRPADYKRDSYNGFGNGLARAFELTVTPALFGFIGHVIDGRARTSPWFMVGFVVFAIVGMFVKLWFGYDTEMKRHEARIGAARRPVGDASDADRSAA